MKSTVLGHLANRFGGQQENLATEALCFILQGPSAASTAFTAFVRQIMPDCPGGLRVETQAGLERAIPDMKCLDNEGRVRVLVENKFWAGLTENQPVTYIKGLPKGVAAVVLFVVPEARRSLVWSEVTDRCKRAEFLLSDVKSPESMMAAEIGGNHYLAVTSWETLLGALATAATIAGESGHLNDITQLQGLCRTMDEEAFLPLRSDELTDLGMARRFINLSDLALGIVNQAASQGLCDRKGLRETNFRYGSGAYVRIGEYTPWVGFDALAWRRRGVSPIWVTFLANSQIGEVREKLSPFRTATPQRCFDSDSGSLLVPISLATGVDKQSIITDAVDKIRELALVLGVQEIPSTASNHPLTNYEDATPGQHAASYGEPMAGEVIPDLCSGEDTSAVQTNPSV
jgi:hypothetical protein